MSVRGFSARASSREILKKEWVGERCIRSGGKEEGKNVADLLRRPQRGAYLRLSCVSGCVKVAAFSRRLARKASTFVTTHAGAA